jgi:uncharacterized protein (TIGR00369 family)
MSDARLDELRQRFARSEFHSTWLGLRLERLEVGEAVVALDVEAKHRNLMGTLHGGMISTLADTATGVAMGSSLDEGLSWTTTSLSVTFLSAGREGIARATGRVVKRGRRFGYAEADVESADGTLLARATATFAIMAARDTTKPGDDAGAAQ